MSEEEAFDIPSRVSQKSNTKLRDVALQVVDSTQSPKGNPTQGSGT